MVYQITLQESNGTLVVGTFFYYFFSLSFLMRIGRKAATAATALGTTDFVFITISQISWYYMYVCVDFMENVFFPLVFLKNILIVTRKKK